MEPVTLPAPQTLQPRWTASVDDYIHVLAGSPDSQSWLVGTAEGVVQVLDAQTGAPRWAGEAHPLGALCGGWSADGRWVATGGADGTLQVREADTGNLVLKTPVAGRVWVEHLAWDPHQADRLAVTAGRHLRVFALARPEPMNFTEQLNTLSGLGWHPTLAGQLASVSYNGLCRWKVGDLNPARRFYWKGSLLRLAWSPDGVWIASGTQDGTLHVWKAKSGEDLQMSGYATKLDTFAWDPTSRWLATGGSAEITVWDFSGRGPVGSEPAVLVGHDGLVRAVAFSPLSRCLASVGQDGRVVLWAPHQSDKPLAQGEHGCPASALVWSTDGQTFASGDVEGTLRLWTPPA